MDTNNDPLEMLPDLAKAIIEANLHVCRQEEHGKHNQDRLDAVEWQGKYGALVTRAKKYIRQVKKDG